MNMRKRLIAASVLALVAASGIHAQEFTLRAGHGAQAQHPTQYGLEHFAELVAERTNGAVEVEVYPNRQLGEERELVEGLQLGTVDLAVVSTGPLGAFSPEINVLDMPFLFRDSEHAYAVFDGEIGQSLLSGFDAQGITGLAIWENGWRHLTIDKEVTEPSDLEGVRLRTMENQVHMDAFAALGANPMPMVWGEVYTSLEQGVIDAQENPITVIYTNQLWEVQDRVVLTQHVYGPHVFLASTSTLERLPEEYRQIIEDAALEAAQFQREKSAELEAEQMALLKEEGMEIVEIDIAPFQEAMAPIYEKYSSQFGEELVQSIIQTEQ